MYDDRFEQELRQLRQIQNYIIQHDLVKDNKTLDLYIECFNNSQPNQRFNLMKLMKLLFTEHNKQLAFNFKQWLQETSQIPIQKDVISLLCAGEIQECVQSLKHKMRTENYDNLIKFNFTMKSTSVEQQNKRQNLIYGLKYYQENDEQVQSMIAIMLGDIDTLIEASEYDWRKFVMLLLQFYDPTATKQEIQNFLMDFQNQTDDQVQLFYECFIAPNLLTALIQISNKGLPHIAYFLMDHFASQLPETQKIKREQCFRILEQLRNYAFNLDLMIYFSNEIKYWNDMIKDSGDIRLDALFTNKLNAIVQNTDDPNTITEIIKSLNQFPIQKQGKIELSKFLLESILNNYSDNQLELLFDSIRLINDQKLLEHYFQTLTKLLTNEITAAQDQMLFTFITNFDKNKYAGLSLNKFLNLLQVLAIRYNVRTDEFPIKSPFLQPDLIIQNITIEYVQFLLELPPQDRRMRQLEFSNLLRSSTNQNPKLLKKKQILSLLINKL